MGGDPPRRNTDAPSCASLGTARVRSGLSSGFHAETRERKHCLRCYWTVRRALLALMALTSAVAVTGACGVAGRTDPADVSSQTTVDPTADRPKSGRVVRLCGSHYATDFDAGLESRIVHAGPVALVGFRVSPVPDEGAPVRTFKAMVRLDAGTDAELETMTAGTALLYDRARFSTGNVYQLSDGDRSVRFTGCPDQSAVFNGAILTAGPRTVDLQLKVGGQSIPVRVSAFGG